MRVYVLLGIEQRETRIQPRRKIIAEVLPVLCIGLRFDGFRSAAFNDGVAAAVSAAAGTAAGGQQHTREQDKRDERFLFHPKCLLVSENH